MGLHDWDMMKLAFLLVISCYQAEHGTGSFFLFQIMPEKATHFAQVVENEYRDWGASICAGSKRRVGSGTNANLSQYYCMKVCLIYPLTQWLTVKEDKVNKTQIWNVLFLRLTKFYSKSFVATAHFHQVEYIRSSLCTHTGSDFFLKKVTLV